MTVCIASIYDGKSVLGASDRMVTGGYGDITFEPPAPKILWLTTSIAVLTAGDQSIQIQIFSEVYKKVQEKIKAEPTKWLDVSEVANMYSVGFFDLKKSLIEKQILSPYGLTTESFVTKQKDMSKDFIDGITFKIDRFSVGSISTIVTGVDTTGAHIYVIENGKISCHDKLGFASIGIGSGHALLHFMSSEYSRNATEAQALLTIHQAKKKSEVSPGVGKDTDMCVISSVLGNSSMIAPPNFTKPIIKDLDKIYEEYKRSIRKVDRKAEKKIKDYLSNLNENTTKTQEVVATSPDDKPLKIE